MTSLANTPAVNAPAAALSAVGRSGVRSGVSPCRASSSAETAIITPATMNGRGQAKQKMAVASEERLNLPMQPGADLHVRRDQRGDHGGDEDNRAAERDPFRAGRGHSPNITWTSSWPGLSRQSTSLLWVRNSWMPGTRPGMTRSQWKDLADLRRQRLR